MNARLRERFYQRYGVELTSEILRELVVKVMKGEGELDPPRGDHHRIWVNWNGQQVGIAYKRAGRYVFVLTFVPPRTKTCWSLPKRRAKRGRFFSH